MSVAPYSTTVSCRIPVYHQVHGAEDGFTVPKRRARRRRQKRRDLDDENNTDTHYVEIVFEFEEGEDVHQKVAAFCDAEGIPEAFRLTLLSNFESLFAELRSSANVQHVAENFINLEELDNSVTDIVGSVADRGWEAWLRATGDFTWNEKPNTSDSAATPEPVTESSEQMNPQQGKVSDVDFCHAFKEAMHHRGEYYTKLFYFERMDAINLGKALKNMELALAQLQDKQSVEMDRVLADMDVTDEPIDEPEPEAVDKPVDGDSGEDESAPMTVFQYQSNTDRISQLVNQHVAHTKALEDSWWSEINKLKRRQRESYRSFVKSLYVNEIVPQVHSPSTKALISPEAKQPTSPLSSPSPQLLDGNSTQSAPSYIDKEKIIESHEIWLGSAQRKSSFKINLVHGDVIDLCKRDFSESELDVRRVITDNLYSEQLSGIVLPHKSPSVSEIGGVGASPKVKQFVKICDKSTEYHFRSLRNQMRSVKILAQKKDNNKVRDVKASGSDVDRLGQGVLQPGDSFITVHSNLLRAHAVFHLIDSPKQVDPDTYPGYEIGKNAVLDGLRQIILLASQHGVFSLSIPVVLTETHHFQSSLTPKPPSPAIMKQIEMVLYCVRSCLAELVSDTNSCLGEVSFMVPVTPRSPLDKSEPEEPPLIRHCRAVFANVFQLG